MKAIYCYPWLDLSDSILCQRKNSLKEFSENTFAKNTTISTFFSVLYSNKKKATGRGGIEYSLVNITNRLFFNTL